MDNPTIGEYTKGVSANCVGYFKGLERRAHQEKSSLRGVAIDLNNPLFAIINGPVDPLGLDQKGRVRAPEKGQNVDKPVDKQAVQVPKTGQNGAKKAWKAVSLAELKEIFAAQNPRKSMTKKARK